MKSWFTYPELPDLNKVGPKYIEQLLKGVIVVQNYLHGEMFSFGQFADTFKTMTRFRHDCIEPVFKDAVEQLQWIAKSKQLHNCWTYRAVLTEDGVKIVDISVGDRDFLYYTKMIDECGRLGLGFTPRAYCGETTLEEIQGLARDRGKPVAVKNYRQFLMGKATGTAVSENGEAQW